MGRPSLTTLQARTLRYINWHKWRYGEPPTVNVLADGFGRLEQQMRLMLRRMARDGAITMGVDVKLPGSGNKPEV